MYSSWTTMGAGYYQTSATRRSEQRKRQPAYMEAKTEYSTKKCTKKTNKKKCTKKTNKKKYTKNSGQEVEHEEYDRVFDFPLSSDVNLEDHSLLCVSGSPSTELEKYAEQPNSLSTELPMSQPVGYTTNC